MLRAEFRKTWARPMVIAAFLLVCLAQVYQVASDYNSSTRAYSEYFNHIGGVMDKAWAESIYAEFDRLWPIPPQSQEELLDAGLEQNAILSAYDHTQFTSLLDSHVGLLKDYYGQDPSFDTDQIDLAYADLREASEKGELVFGMSPAGNGMTNQNSITWGFLLFMMVLCVDLFSGERQTGMIPIQEVTKQGRRTLFRAKFMVCQISALIVWAVANGIYALSLTVAYGWGNPGSVVQDFIYNACPWNWSSGEFMAVLLVTGLLASQVVAGVIFLIARISGNTQKSFTLMGLTLILPYLIAFQADIPVLYVWLPCLMNNSWLWRGLMFWNVMGVYIQPWQIAGAELILIGLAVGLALHRLAKKAENAAEI